MRMPMLDPEPDVTVSARRGVAARRRADPAPARDGLPLSAAPDAGQPDARAGRSDPRRRVDRRARGRPRRRGQDRRVRLRRDSRASSTATPTCRSPAGGRGSTSRRSAACPTSRFRRDGGGIASSARALDESSDEQVLAQSAALAAEMLAAGTTTFECKSGYGLSREGELRALALARELDGRVAQTTTSTALLAHSVPPRLQRGCLDGGGRGDAARGDGARQRERARHLRRVDRVRATSTWPRWAAGRRRGARPALPCRAVRRPIARCRSPWRRAPARSTTSRPCTGR